jgi:hypothetical protein
MMSWLGFSAPEVKEDKKAAGTESTSATVKKSTDMSFDELLVQGKYHFTDEAVTTVEQDKVLDGLLEVRKDFKDRIQQSAARY